MVVEVVGTSAIVDIVVLYEASSGGSDGDGRHIGSNHDKCYALATQSVS